MLEFAGFMPDFARPLLTQMSEFAEVSKGQQHLREFSGPDAGVLAAGVLGRHGSRQRVNGLRA
jgi:alanine dehydrogenase